MKFAFDVSDLATNRADGTTRYTRELAQRLPVLTSHDQWTFFSPGALPDDIPIAQNVTTAISPWPKYWTQLRLPFDLSKHHPDVLFMPIQQLPYIRPKKTKTVAVIHDLAFHRYPEQFTYKEWALLHVFSAYVARQADAIIAVSHATAQDIATQYGRTDNVHVIHHGVEHTQFRPANTEEYLMSLDQLKHHYPKLHKPYLLYVGQIQPRKNLVRLIEAFEEAHEAHPELSLVIAGGHGWLQQPILERIKTSRVHEHIHLLGRVPDSLLTPLYWHAEAFVLPSLYEGFGMPILEAMASGCPVITSNVSSMPEVTRDAAVLIDPTDTHSITHGIYHALTRKGDLRQRGLRRAQEFSWDKTTREIVRVLKSL